MNEIIIDDTLKIKINNENLVDIKTNYINFFIGGNNSGKSKVAREILKQKDELLSLAPSIEIIKDTYKEEMKNISTLPNLLSYLSRSSSEISEIYTLIQIIAKSRSQRWDTAVSTYDNYKNNNGTYYYKHNINNDTFEKIEKFFKFAKFSRDNFEFIEKYNKITVEEFLLNNPNLIKNILKENGFVNLDGRVINKIDISHKIHIPYMRTLEKKIETGSYTGSLFSAFGYTGANIRLVNGSGFNDSIKDKMLGDINERNNFGEFIKFIKDNIFRENDEIDIASRKGEEIHILIDGIERPFNHLGDGIQNLLVILYEVYFNRNSLIMIDEPEISLHPRKQKELVRILQADEIRKNNNRFLITTHSNYMISTDNFYEKSDYTVFRIEKEENDDVTNLNIVKFQEIDLFNEMGIEYSDLYIPNFLILVEGGTDIQILEAYIKKRKPDFKKGIDYAFIPYGGNVLSNWIDLEIDKEINHGNYLILSDADYKDNKKNNKHNERKKYFGDKYIVWDSMELEMTAPEAFMEEAIKNFKKDDRRYNFEDKIIRKNHGYGGKNYFAKKLVEWLENKENRLILSTGDEKVLKKIVDNIRDVKNDEIN